MAWEIEYVIAEYTQNGYSEDAIMIQPEDFPMFYYREGDTLRLIDECTDCYIHSYVFE